MNLSEPRHPGDHLVLIGPMGAGKSSLARHLARLTSRRWMDTDKMVVQRTGIPITEIFAQYGEPEFRRLESEMLQSLGAQERLIVATGGGIVTRQENHLHLRRLGCVIFLTATPEVLFERVSRNQNRPLLHTENPESTLRELLAARLELYTACADFQIDTSGGTHEGLAQEVLGRAQSFFANTAALATTNPPNSSGGS